MTIHASSRSFGAIMAVVLSIAGVAIADVRPAAIFSDHMVLQQGAVVPVWGWADPDEKITVSIAGQSQTTSAGQDRKWMVKLSDLKSGGPLEMTISSEKNSITIHDVLIGEVWLGSGQSNMEFTVSKSAKRFAGVTNEEQEIAAADYPQIRTFTVPMKLSPQPQEDCEGRWEVCSPQTVGSFSAVGYFFSRQLQKSINRPIGFINSSYGASTAQCWISQDAIESKPELKLVLDDYASAMAGYEKAVAATRESAPATAPATTPSSRRNRAPRDPAHDQHSPFLCYNAMIRPIQPYAIRGMLWYQGESITTGGAQLYPKLIEALVTSWRKQWNQPNLPFYFVQLAALDNNSNRPEVREAQAQALKLPNTAMAVTIDIGDKKNVHPKNKQDLGDRLARIARANVYGEKIEYSGPVYESMQVEGNSIRVRFTHIGAGLVAKDGELKTFQIAGEDHNFVPAIARIENDTIVVSSPDVTKPVAVRYAWNRWPEGCNLYNADGLPAATFRTDQW